MSKQFDAIFLDRDGTISHDPYGYINSLSDYHFFDYAFEALKIFSKYTDKFIIVTNQSGLASGKIDLENLEEINSFIYKEFEKRNLPLKKIYFSDNYDEGYDSMRKPGIGMFVKAKEEFNIDISKSLMIGDSIVDMQVGDRLNMKTIFLLTGMGEDYLDEVKSTCRADLISNNLLEAAKELLSI
ncbi:MAG: HAD-IIIA family hydrolase [Candidatus Marinimicrobia bacterium]|jgi:D-glycero-D-manno-heptose 1,7-bisphosphate phosphatase|nr:HAD-IIIA family hydrolase [Candidatus Neomarinimicrobiota bacterium]|tara:strand:+ start:5662 stop:6213 length:552 start_codon:yes stop_codon:yes gene_type:complete